MAPRQVRSLPMNEFPLGVVLYLVLYLGWNTWAFGYQVHRDVTPVGWLIVQGMTDVSLLVAGAAPWMPHLREPLGLWLLALYALGTGVLLLQIVVAARAPTPPV